jgi:acyl-CoA reductase-like NAD-dependent aldehyde dehydrogenase
MKRVSRPFWDRRRRQEGREPDGAFYNAGQSCCGIERVYVARSIYDRFVDAAVALVRWYRMGDPEDSATTLGPLAHRKGAALVEAHVAEARAAGVRVLTGGQGSSASQPC